MSEMHSAENDAPVREYRGWFGRHARRRCPHSRLVGIYGDAINHNGGWRLGCLQCGKYLDGPVHLARARMGEYVIPPGKDRPSLLTAALAGPSPTDEPRKRWLSDREYVIDNPSPTDEGGEGA